MNRFQISLDNLLNPATRTAAATGFVLAPYIDYFYGEGRNDILAVLIFFIIMDWIAGIAAAQKDHTYSSEYGINGIFRTLFILAFPAGSNLLDRAMGTPGFLFYAITFGLIYHTFQSVIANAYRAGWKRFIPQQAVNFVASEIRAKSERAHKQSRQKEDKWNV